MQTTATTPSLPLPVPTDHSNGLEGSVTRIVYDANSGTMRIFEIEDDNRKRHIVRQVSRNTPLPPLSVKDQVRALGHFTNHPTYGRQFNASDVVRRTPTSAAGVAKVISGKAFKGIGPRLANKLVDAFGNELISILNRGDPGELLTAAIGAKKSRVLIDTWLQNQATHMTDALLAELGVGPETRRKIREAIPEIETVIQTDPYRLAREVDGIGFKTADQLAMRAGIFQPASPRRLSVGLLHGLELAAQEGHTGLSREQLIDRTCEALTFGDRKALGEILARDLESQELSLAPNGLVQNRWTATREARLARYLFALSQAPQPLRIPAAAIRAELAQVQARHGLSSEQAGAVAAALTNGASVITGGPGTGKTHTIKAIIDTAQRAARAVPGARPLDILLLAPTGKAADRMSEATGHDASTVHMALGRDFESGGFKHDESNPIEADLIVADEFSMMDTRIADALIRAIAPGQTRLVIVGDINQLASVDPGRVLQDIIESDLFPVTRFTVIRRTGEGSAIAQGAARINAGSVPEFGTPGQSDLVFIEEKDPEAIAKRIVTMLSQSLPAHTGLRPEKMQVLAPGKNSAVGIHALNRELQAALNPTSDLVYGPKRTRVFISGGQPARIGDRVICTKTRYGEEQSIYNGDVGTIVDFIDEHDRQALVVNCGKKTLELDNEYWPNLSHSWALTIHKSQGSEYEIVVIPLTTSHWMLLKRNLFYTGVTRARRLCIVIGSRRALRVALETTDGTSRQTGLLARIRALVGLGT